MSRVIVDIAISSDELMLMYKGVANRALLFSREGLSISLPAHHLRPFISRQGVYGSFILEFDQQGSLLALKRLN